VNNAMDKFWPRGSPTAGLNFGGAGWVLWGVAILCVVFTLWLLIDAWRVRNRIRHLSGGGEGDAERPSLSDGSDRREPRSRAHILVTCQHCQRGILVPKQRRFHQVECPACFEVNPAPKKDRLSFIKGLLRWLLYPSFQDRD
jgi:hypothetical protein